VFTQNKAHNENITKRFDKVQLYNDSKREHLLVAILAILTAVAVIMVAFAK